MSAIPPSPQVNADHYDFANYVSLERWCSYWHQVREVDSIQVSEVLCIGIGDDIVPSILEKKGYRVSRFDLDSTLKPDFVGDVGDIRNVVNGRIFDAVLCCQVLEHQPFDRFMGTVAQLLSITKTRLVVSLPSCHLPLLRLKIGLLRSALVDVNLLVQKFWKPWRFDGEHYWEVGAREYPLSRVDLILNADGFTTRRFRSKEFPFHLFFIIDRT